MARSDKKSRKNQVASLRAVLIGLGPGGPDALPVSTRERIDGARELWAPDDLLRLFPSVPIRHNLLMKRLENRLSGPPLSVSQEVLILCYGDPGMFGLVTLVRAHCDDEQVEIHPGVDPVQGAFSRLKRSWHQASRVHTSFSSLPHIREVLKKNDLVTVTTSEEVPAEAFLNWIRKKGLSEDFRILLFWPEKGVWAHHVQWAPTSSTPLPDSVPASALILFRRGGVDPVSQSALPLSLQEIPDSSMESFHKLSMEETVRNLVSSKLDLYSHEILWDVGASEGAFSIACAHGLDRMDGQGIVQSVEWEDPYLHCFLANLTRHPAERLKLFQGTLEDAWSHLDDPDAVFIHDRIPNMQAVLPRIASRINPGGRLLISTTSFSMTHTLMEYLEHLGFEVDVSLIPQRSELPSTSGEEPRFLCLVLGWKKRGEKP